ncbi:unnamed protein product [Calypogeia fissa]
MEGKLSRSMFIQGIGLTILVVFIVRAIWSLLVNAKWRGRQVFPTSCHPSDKGEILVVEVIGRLDQTAALGHDRAAAFKGNQLPADIDLPSTAVVIPPSMVLPAARVTPEGAEADGNQTPLETFYNVYGGVSPRPRLL